MMKKLPRQLLVITSTVFFCLGISDAWAKADPTSNSQPILTLEDAINLRYQNPDSSIHYLNDFYLKGLRNKDTLMAVKSLMQLAQVYGHQAKYKQSYDKLWTALSYADKAKLDLSKASIYRSLGRFYSFYNRKENALKYLTLSLEINKQLVKEGVLEMHDLVLNYHAFCATYREMNETELGKMYLDSAFMYHSPSKSKFSGAMLKFEKAVLLNREGEHSKALEIFKEILPWYTETSPGVQVLVYYYLGNTYRELGDFAASENCYNSALAISNEFHSHIDFTPLVYEKLADLYFATGNLPRAYESLKKVKALDKKFFDSRSENNRPLLEIQDEFRKEQEQRMKLLQDQKMAQLEQEDKILLLQRTILIGSIIFILMFGLVYFNYVKSKHRSENQLIRKKRELEITQANELLELKNKELAASALKLIEKETFIEKLKNQLSNGNGDIKRHEIKRIVRSISNSNSENWKEFETRFVAVNKRFYETLNERFPELTQGDLKLCALVKLNFSSKEMAKLMGISVESVHTTRYRLRKKLNLDKGANLKEFIASI